MDCNESQRLMSAHVDGELDAPLAAAMDAHLVSCASCREAFGKLRQAQSVVAFHAGNFVAPAALRTRILNGLPAPRYRAQPAIGTAAAGTHGWFERIGTRRWTQINIAMSALCAMLLAAAWLLYAATPSADERLDREIVAAHYRSLLADHLADVASSDRHTVKPWFSGKLDYAPPVIDLAQQGFPLIGGRLDYVGQRAVAGMVYRHGRHLINLFVWPAASRRDSAGQLVNVNGFQLLRWTAGGMQYAAVSDMSASELIEMQSLLQRQTREAAAPATGSSPDRPH